MIKKGKIWAKRKVIVIKPDLESSLVDEMSFEQVDSAIKIFLASPLFYKAIQSKLEDLKAKVSDAHIQSKDIQLIAWLNGKIEGYEEVLKLPQTFGKHLNRLKNEGER